MQPNYQYPPVQLLFSSFHDVLRLTADKCTLYYKKGCILSSHGFQKQTPIKKQVPKLATRLSDKQAAMAGSAVGRAIPAPVVRLMICADGVIGANPQALQRVPKDIGKPGGGRDQTAE